MHHYILGEIQRAEGDSGHGLATIEYDSRKVAIRIIPDDVPFETTLQLAAEVVTRLKELDGQAKQIIVADLREKYNGGWNEYDEAQEDGSLKTVSNPQLSESEFESKFSLVNVNVTGSEMVDFL
jgi:hypothetical protein